VVVGGSIHVAGGGGSIHVAVISVVVGGWNLLDRLP
jgi:hypothetical protein